MAHLSPTCRENHLTFIVGGLEYDHLLAAFPSPERRELRAFNRMIQPSENALLTSVIRMASSVHFSRF
jgi:hypothetical protein